MKKVKLLLLALVALCMGDAQAQQLPPLPVDSAVRIGKLSNGLTYYIRHNEEPKGQAHFYIAQKVGSIQEDDSQRGLAHFLEHMAFNGSKHFPEDGQLVKYCERIGVKFGQNLNAYTSTDETVYNINNVPMTGSNLDSCLYILADWSGGLFLTEKEIDKERGVIREEWRMRTSGYMRIIERQLPNLYPGSKYGHRMPIGLMDIVENFHPDTLRAYYKKWYHPDLQGVVVVGDVNVDEVEAKIKTIFSAIPRATNAPAYVDYPVPANPTPIYIVDKDKEISSAALAVMFKHEPMPRELRGTYASVAVDYINGVIAAALNERLNELSQKPDCPFLNAQSGYGTYILSKMADNFEIYIMPKPNQSAAALQAVMQEVERARRFGITGSEIFRARENILSGIETIYNNRDKQKHEYYTQQYVRHFLDGDAIPDIKTEFETYKMLAQQIPAEAVNATLAQYVASVDTNFVVFATFPDKEGVDIPTADALKAAVQAARAAQLEAYVDNTKNEPLVPVLPKKGKIKKEEAAPFGYTKWTLSNGARVYYKKTDFNDAQFSFGARSFGGSSLVSDADIINSKLVDGVIASSGLGAFKSTELQKALAGKVASISSSIGVTGEELNGGSTPKDIRTLFELIYLKFQEPTDDPDAYHNVINSLKTQLINADKNPQKAFSDSIMSTLFPNQPRRRSITLADLEKADYAAIKRIYRDRFRSAGDFDFFFTGAFDVDSLRQFTEQYIAALPGVKKREQYRDLKIEPVSGVVDNRFYREMETPQAMLVQLWSGKTPYTMQKAITADALGEILTKRYLKSIREDGGLAYNVHAGGSADYGVHDTYTLQIYCPFTPEKVDSVLYLMDLGLKEIAQKGVTPEELGDIKKFNEKQYVEHQRSNDYWEGLIVGKVRWDKDKQTGYLDALRALTSQDLQAFARDIVIKNNNRATIIMLPKEKAAK